MKIKTCKAKLEEMQQELDKAHYKLAGIIYESYGATFTDTDLRQWIRKDFHIDELTRRIKRDAAGMAAEQNKYKVGSGLRIEHGEDELE